MRSPKADGCLKPVRAQGGMAVKTHHAAAIDNGRVNPVTGTPRRLYFRRSFAWFGIGRDVLLRRIDGVLAARRYSLLEYNCPADKLEEATKVTPGFSSPTVQSLVDKNWFAVRVLVERGQVHRILDELSALGCVAILESEVRSKVKNATDLFE